MGQLLILTTQFLSLQQELGKKLVDISSLCLPVLRSQPRWYLLGIAENGQGREAELNHWVKAFLGLMLAKVSKNVFVVSTYCRGSSPPNSAQTHSSNKIYKYRGVNATQTERNWEKMEWIKVPESSSLTNKTVTNNCVVCVFPRSVRGYHC